MNFAAFPFRAHLEAALAIVKRDLLMYASYRLRFVTQCFQALFSVTLFYYISRLVRVGSIGSPDDYFAYAVIGLVILEVLTLTLGTLPTDLRQELVAGTFERLVLSPFGAVGGVISMTLFPVVLGLVAGVVTLTFATLIFGLHLVATAPLAIPVAALGALAFLPFAIMLAGLMLCVKQVGAGASYLIALFSLIGGFYFPVSLLPRWISWTSDVQPFTPTVDLLRHLLAGAPLREPMWLSFTKLGLSILVLTPLAIALLRVAVRISQRRGTIIEY